MHHDIHIGMEIRKLLNEQQRSVTWLADEINCDHSNLNKQLKKPHLHAEMLYNISVALGKDLFAFYSQSLDEMF